MCVVHFCPLRSTVSLMPLPLSHLLYCFLGYRTTPIFYINGKRVSDTLAAKARPAQTLLSYLRDVLGLTGTKLGCAEGGCGACTVMISRWDSAEQKILHYSANACLMPVLAADSTHVTTIEGIGSVRGGLHPLQSAMVDMHGSQCGFCTPGIIVAIYSLLANKPEVKYVEEHLDGNLCRCTGYRPIWDAARSVCVDAATAEVGEPIGPCGTPCRECPERDTCTLDCNVADGGGGGGNGSTSGLEEEKKLEVGGNGCCGGSGSDGGTTDKMCCTSSKDKMTGYLSTLPTEAKGGPSIDFLDQPNQMFPEDLKTASDGDGASNHPLVVMDQSAPRGGTWFKPTMLEELLGLLHTYAEQGGCKIVVGNTEVGIGEWNAVKIECNYDYPPTFDFFRYLILPPSNVYASATYFSSETKFKQAFYPRYIYPSHSIESLYDVSFTSKSIKIGACAPLSTLQHVCETVEADDTSSVALKRIAGPIKNMLRWFASSQIRNVACLGGNLVTASPISDMNPMLAALGAKLVLTSVDGQGSVSRRKVSVSEFFLRYRTVDLKPYELVEYIEIPVLAQSMEFVAPFKQARRREDDISIVTSGMRMLIAPEEDGYIIKEASMAFGGMAPTTVMASKTAAELVGKPFVADTFRAASQTLMDELYLPEDVPGGQAEYRRALASSYLYQFYLHCVGELELDISRSNMPLPNAPVVADKEKSGAESFVSSSKPSIGGTQKYPTPKVATGLEGRDKDCDPPEESVTKPALEKDAVGKAKPHASGPLHCTGEALYVDDIPLPPSTLHAQLVLATQCDVEMLSIDVTPATLIPGVEAVYTYKDLETLGGNNTLGPITKDEFCFLPIGQKAVFVGQPIGICIAQSLEIAELGAKSVAVQYGESKGGAEVTIDQVSKRNSKLSVVKQLPLGSHLCLFFHRSFPSKFTGHQSEQFL